MALQQRKLLVARFSHTTANKVAVICDLKTRPDELNLALHWYVRTVEAHKLKKLDGSTNAVAFWDKGFCERPIPELVGRCRPCISLFGTDTEKDALRVLNADERENGLRFSSLIKFVCRAHMATKSVAMIKGAAT